MSGLVGNPFLLTSAGGATGYQIERSLRFNSSDSASCSRSFTSAGNRRTWTLSLWVKRSAIAFSAEQHIWGVTGTTDATYGEMFFGTGDTLRFAVGYNTTYGITTTRVFRDPSAWYHIVLAFDATQSTAANKIKLYINGVEETTFSSDTRSSIANQDWGYNNNVAHYIGRQANSDIRQFNGYLADIHFIDGQALTPSSFTEVSATTGQLIPKAYTGSFGTNGFWLKFSDNSAATATTLGKDYSGNSNNWTPNNLSVTAGAGNDSLVDTPTSYGTDTGAGGEVRGNYATLNPLAYGGDIQAPTNGNLDVTSGTSSDGSILGTFGMSSGKWYFEVTCNNTSTSGIGIAKSGVALADYPGQQPEAWVVQTQTPFYKVNNNTPTALTGTFNSGDVIGVAFDADNGNLSFYQNGSVIGSNAFTGLTNGPYLPIVGDSNSTPSISLSCNFGQRPFAYTAPSGFKALCDTNLPAPVVAKPSEVMDVVLYTGNSTDNRAITGLGFSPDLVWFGPRSQSGQDKVICDSVRGVQKALFSNQTYVEADPALYGSVGSFDSNGFTIKKGIDATFGFNQVNLNSSTYVAWTWDAGTTTSSNGSGSITSTVRANASAGFSIVTWTPQAAAGTVGHGLGVAPEFIITKDRDTANGWFTYHKSLGAQKYLQLNSTAAVVSNSTVFTTAPTSTVVDQGSSFTSTIGYGKQVLYCFAPVAGYSSFGSYTGNGSTDGPFVYTGFRPKWLLIKNASSSYDGGGTTVNSASWYLYDSARGPYNGNGNVLAPNKSYSEENNLTDVDFLANGFKIRNNRNINGNADTMVYAAFAESPLQYARAR